MTIPLPLRNKLVANLAALAGYYAAARLGLILSDPITNITMVWPATGIAVVMLLRAGIACWPGIFLAAVLVERSVNHSWPVSSSIAVTNTLGPMLTAWLLKRGKFDPAFERPADAAVFCAAAAMGMLITASGGALNLCLSGRIPWDAFVPAGVRWWLGDSGGVLLAGSMGLAVSRRHLEEIGRRWREFALLLGASAIGGWLVLAQRGVSPTETIEIAFLTTPMVVLGAIRFGVLGAFGTALCLSSIAAAATAVSRGPFFMPDMLHGTLLLWLYGVANLGLGLMTTSLLAGRIRAERALRGSEASHRAILESALDCIVAMDHEGRIIEFNPAAERTFGYARAEALGQPLADLLLPPSQRELHRRGLNRHLATGEGPVLGRRLELTAMRKGGVEFPVDLTITRVAGAEPPVFTGFIRDITERKLVEAAAQSSQQMLQLVMDNIPQGVFWKDRESRYIGCNATIVRHRGVANAEALKGKTDRDFGALRPEQADSFLRKDREVMDSGQPQLGIVEQTTHSNGSTRWLETNKVPLRDPGGNVIGVLGTWQDITERKQTEESLKMMRFSVDHAADGVVWVGRDGRILYANDAMCAGRGYSREEILTLRVFDLNPDYQSDIWEPTFNDIKRRENVIVETRHRTKDGRIFPVEVSASYVFINGQEFIFATVRDLTERMRHERLAQRSQRLEAIGTLAGGVAHDLNNALAPIVMGLQLMRVEYPGESKIVDMFEASARRGAEMVRHLLAFAKGAEGERTAIQLHRLVRELENLMKASFPKNIRLEIECEPGLPTVLGDSTQLHQVLLNLCVNARDAMPDGGVLTLDAKRVAMDAEQAGNIPYATPGDYIALRVKDTGTGIPPEILDRIFDPFFTTKGPDKGTGLGLSTCMGIVKGHGGFLHVDSQPGQGSTFTAFLPVASEAGPNAFPSKTPGGFLGQGETILFVDDESGVRKVAGVVLRHMNFKPLIAADGADGLILLAEHRDQIRAIVTDLHMPRMDGLAFVREVRRLLPAIPIVVASGRMEEHEAEKLAALGVTNRLDKPFTQAQFADALKKLLAPE